MSNQPIPTDNALREGHEREAEGVDLAAMVGQCLRVPPAPQPAGVPETGAKVSAPPGVNPGMFAGLPAHHIGSPATVDVHLVRVDYEAQARELYDRAKAKWPNATYRHAMVSLSIDTCDREPPRPTYYISISRFEGDVYISFDATGNSIDEALANAEKKRQDALVTPAELAEFRAWRAGKAANQP